MARLFSQMFAAIYLVVLVLGLVLGNAVRTPGGQAGGNLGGVTVHMTYARDVLNGLVLLVLVYVGFIAGRRAGRLAVIALGVAMIALAVAGFVVGDDDAASKGFLAMNFPPVVNVLTLVTGVLALLAGLGTVEEPEAARLR